MHFRPLPVFLTTVPVPLTMALAGLTDALDDAFTDLCGAFHGAFDRLGGLRGDRGHSQDYACEY